MWKIWPARQLEPAVLQRQLQLAMSAWMMDMPDLQDAGTGHKVESK